MAVRRIPPVDVTVRVGALTSHSKILERLKIADPERFKNVTTLGVLPPPPPEPDTDTDTDTGGDTPVVQPLPDEEDAE